VDLSGGRQSIHVLGIEEPNQVVSYLHRGSINGSTVAEVLDDYASHIRKTTALVLDNASPHTCKLIQNKHEEWESKGLILIPLPAYSPELNDIERTWKDVKYTKLPTEAWGSLKSLFTELTHTFQKLAPWCLCLQSRGLFKMISRNRRVGVLSPLSCTEYGVKD